MRVTPPSGPRRRGPRAYLEPLGPGPWLRDQGPAVVWKALLSWGVALFLGGWGVLLVTTRLGPQWVPSLTLVFVMSLAAMIIVTGLVLGVVNGFTPQWTQVCPQCLGQMMRTATRCPHCHFTPSRSDG